MPLSPSLIISVISFDITHSTCTPRSSESRIGEYFSGSLAAVDLDGDGLDELLVGSPLASVKQARTNHFLYGDIQRKYSLSSKLLFSLHTTIAMSVIIRLVQKGMEIILPR